MFVHCHTCKVTIGIAADCGATAIVCYGCKRSLPVTHGMHVSNVFDAARELARAIIDGDVPEDVDDLVAGLVEAEVGLGEFEEELADFLLWVGELGCEICPVCEQISEGAAHADSGDLLIHVMTDCERGPRKPEELAAASCGICKRAVDDVTLTEICDVEFAHLGPVHRDCYRDLRGRETR